MDTLIVIAFSNVNNRIGNFTKGLCDGCNQYPGYVQIAKQQQYAYHYIDECIQLYIAHVCVCGHRVNYLPAKFRILLLEEDVLPGL